MREPVTLSPLDSRSAEIIARWGGDPEFSRAAEWSVNSDEASSAFWRSMAVSPPEHLLRFAAITVTDVVGYLDIHGSGDRRELGFVIGPGRWGRGFGGAVARAGLEYAFDRLALQCVWAEAWATNTASIAILKGLGMHHLGRGENGSYLGEATHYEQFELNRAEWSQRHPGVAHVPRRRSELVADHGGQIRNSQKAAEQFGAPMPGPAKNPRIPGRLGTPVAASAAQFAPVKRGSSVRFRQGPSSRASVTPSFRQAFAHTVGHLPTDSRTYGRCMAHPQSHHARH